MRNMNKSEYGASVAVMPPARAQSEGNTRNPGRMVSAEEKRQILNRFRHRGVHKVALEFDLPHAAIEAIVRERIDWPTTSPPPSLMRRAA